MAAFATLTVTLVGSTDAIQTGVAVDDNLDTGGGAVKLSAAANQAMRTDMGQQYSGRTTATVVSYIMSTPGDSIHVDGTEISVSRAKEDVEENLENDLDASLSVSTRELKYSLTVEKLDGEGQAIDSISVGAATQTGGGEFVTQDVQLWRNQRARATLFVSKQGGVGLYR